MGHSTNDTNGNVTRRSDAGRMPVTFLPHGGGPWPFVDVGFGSKEELEALAQAQ